MPGTVSASLHLEKARVGSEYGDDRDATLVWATRAASAGNALEEFVQLRRGAPRVAARC